MSLSYVVFLSESGVRSWLHLVVAFSRSWGVRRLGLLHFGFGVRRSAFGLHLVLAFSWSWGVRRLAFGSDLLQLVIYLNESLTLSRCWGLILLRRPTSSSHFVSLVSHDFIDDFS